MSLFHGQIKIVKTCLLTPSCGFKSLYVRRDLKGRFETYQNEDFFYFALFGRYQNIGQTLDTYLTLNLPHFIF